MTQEQLIEKELNRLEKVDDMKLLDIIMNIDKDPCPEWVKDLVMKKINQIMNARLGIQ